MGGGQLVDVTEVTVPPREYIGRGSTGGEAKTKSSESTGPKGMSTANNEKIWRMEAGLADIGGVGNR